MEMDMKHIIRRRAVSLVLTFLMAIGCTFNTGLENHAAADSGNKESGVPMSLLTVVNSTPTPADITWSRSRETDQVARNVDNTNWTWSTAGAIGLSTTDPARVWDGQTSPYFTGYTSRVDHPSATWRCQSNTDLRRFQGNFKIPAGFQKTDTVRYSSVNQSNYADFNEGNIIPINDDIFIFCYKKGTVLTDDNYLDYLAFWSGTSGPRDGRYGKDDGKSFHGRPGNQSHNTDASSSAIHFTDGWYVEADLDNIGTLLFQNGTPAAGDDYVIDIFTQEYATGGGMDEPQITFTHSNDYRVQAQNDYYQTTSGIGVDLDLLSNDKVYLNDEDITDKDSNFTSPLSVDPDSLVSSTSGITLSDEGSGNYSVLQGTAEIGDLAVDADGTGTFTPAADYSGNVQFKYTATCTGINNKTYTADAYVTIRVKNLDLNKTAQYTGNFDSTTGVGNRTYQLSLSASVHPIGDTYEECTKPYSALPDGTYYTDDQGTTAVTKRTQIIPETYNWFKSGVPISLTNLYTRTAELPTITYQKVSYNTVVNGGDPAASYSILLSGGTRIPLTYYGKGRSSYSGTRYSAWTSGSNYYYYDEYELIWQYNNEDNYHESWELDGAQFQKMITTPNYQYNQIDVATVPVAGVYYFTNTSGRYDPVTWTVTPATTGTAWYNASDVKISPPTTLYQVVATNAAIDGAEIQDTIDPRFVVLLNDSNTVITDEAGTTTLDNGGVVSYDDEAQVWKVVWRSQTIPVAPATWSKTVNVKAKADFFGGNDIPTNVAADSYVALKDGSVKIRFNQPTVNVPIYIPKADASKDIFLGETVGTTPSGLFDAAAFNDASSLIWCGRGQTGTISAKWYYDANGNTPAGGVDSSTITALTPSDRTLYYFIVTYTPANNGTASAAAGGGLAVPTTSVTSVYTVNVKKGQLTLTKTITGTADPNQFFTFRIERFAYTDTNLTGAVLSTSYEVIHGAGSKVITNLPQGNYKVTEISKSAWRYVQQGDIGYNLGKYLGRNANQTTFTDSITANIANQLSNDKWISSKDSVTNVFTTAVQPE